MKRFFAAAYVLSWLVAGQSFAGSATWKLNPTNSDWSSAANWTPASVPDGVDDIATFNTSNVTSVDLGQVSGVNTIVFSAGASTYNLMFGLGTHGDKFTVSGSGIVNNSGMIQTISVYPNAFGDSYTNDFIFTGNASAGDLIHFEMVGEDYDVEEYGGWLQFEDNASAGTAVINNPANISEWGGTRFYDSSSADKATIYNSEGKGSGGLLFFFDNSSAGNATIVNKGAVQKHAYGGATTFWGAVTAGNSTIICENSPSVDFIQEAYVDLLYEADGGTARFILLGNGTLSISYHDAPGVTVGSVEGDGLVLLGAKNLTTGSNSLSTTFSGRISGNGSLTKIGNGKLILANASIYTGGTTVNGGTLLVNNTTGSGLGTGPVLAVSGIFGGSGTISGRVTMGTGRGTGVTLGPGANSVIPGTLTIGKQLALKSDATYRITLNSSTVAADQVMANGVRIVGAQIVFNDVADAVLPPGTVFTVISNTSGKAISGTFSNLADGAAITVGSNTFQANYEGADGNDLTLTVVE